MSALSLTPINATPNSAPNSAIECEMAVLGAVLCHNERYWPCVEAGLQPEHFATDLHERLWQAMAAQITAGLQSSPFTLSAQFANDPDWEALGGHRYFARLAVTSAGVINIAGYAKAVREWGGRRLVARLIDYVSANVLNGQSDFAGLLAEMESCIDECRPAPVGGGLRPISHGLALAVAANQRARERGMVDGVPFGLKALDTMIGGAAKSDLVILAGRPGMGKSALAASIALHNARAGKKVALFSLEMSEEQIANRLLAEGAGASADLLRRGETNAVQHAAMMAAEQALRDLPLFVDQTGAIDPSEMRARLKRLGPVDLCVVDYLQLMTSPRHAENRVQEVSAITAALKTMAKEFNMPIVALSQLSRAVEQRDDKRPHLADLRDSGSIEQDADAVIFIYREHYYLSQEEPDETSPAYDDWRARLGSSARQTELIVSKNRHGPCGTAKVGFDAPFTRFYDLV